MKKNIQAHPFHLVEPSPWPLASSLALLITTISAVMYFNNYANGGLLLTLGLISTVLSMSLWFRDIIIEARTTLVASLNMAVCWKTLRALSTNLFKEVVKILKIEQSAGNQITLIGNGIIRDYTPSIIKFSDSIDNNKITKSRLEESIVISDAVFLIIIGFFVTFLSLDVSLLLSISSQEGILSFLIPIMIYENVETDKSKVLSDNVGKAGIYLWTHKGSSKKYVGSAVDLSKRLKDYYSSYELKQMRNYISNALISHGHPAFSLSILEIIDISGKSKEEARKLILEREQYYLDLIFSKDESNTYNILKVAGSSLGFKHSEETKALMRKPKSEGTRILMSGAQKGKTHSAETKALMSVAQKSVERTGKNNPMYSKSHTAEAKLSARLGTVIYVYDTQDTLVNTFSSARKAALHFECSQNTILKYTTNKGLFKDKWKLSTSLISKD